MSLGVYISIPFCRTKCSYCNFASDVFSRAAMQPYVDRMCRDIANAEETCRGLGGQLTREVDSIYLGGGTPTVLAPGDLLRIFDALKAQFDILPDAEITVECAPGTLTAELLETLLRCRVNRVSLGVQSFVDQESSAVGRIHKAATTLADIDQLRRAGISNINLDLIAGLPHQTANSWNTSLSAAVETGVPHISVYMLEVDEDSRLGRELMAGGTRYHAHFVPDDSLTVHFYETACDRLASAGIRQYEISNFARPGFESRHNLKYWTRAPYVGFGMDAHSMLPALSGLAHEAVRFSTADSLPGFTSGAGYSTRFISQPEALQESFYLGLRLLDGVNLNEIRAEFGRTLENFQPQIEELVTAGLLDCCDEQLKLTRRGILLSNEVFEQFISTDSAVV